MASWCLSALGGYHPLSSLMDEVGVNGLSDYLAWTVRYVHVFDFKVSCSFLMDLNYMTSACNPYYFAGVMSKRINAAITYVIDTRHGSHVFKGRTFCSPGGGLKHVRTLHTPLIMIPFARSFISPSLPVRCYISHSTALFTTSSQLHPKPHRPSMKFLATSFVIITPPISNWPKSFALLGRNAHNRKKKRETSKRNKDQNQKSTDGKTNITTTAKPGNKQQTRGKKQETTKIIKVWGGGIKQDNKR